MSIALCKPQQPTQNVITLQEFSGVVEYHGPAPITPTAETGVKLGLYNSLEVAETAINRAKEGGLFVRFDNAVGFGLDGYKKVAGSYLPEGIDVKPGTHLRGTVHMEDGALLPRLGKLDFGAP